MSRSLFSPQYADERVASSAHWAELEMTIFLYTTFLISDLAHFDDFSFAQFGQWTGLQIIGQGELQGRSIYRLSRLADTRLSSMQFPEMQIGAQPSQSDGVHGTLI